MLAEELARAEDIVRERRVDLLRVAEALREHEVLSGDKVTKVVPGQNPPP
jgi:ATP-dependent Zn protease